MRTWPDVTPVSSLPIIKPWPNGLASERKFSTCVYLGLRLAKACVHLRWLAMTCAHFGRDQICTQVDASFSPFGYPTQVSASWVTSINLLLANEIQDMSALKWVFCDFCVLGRKLASPFGHPNASFYASPTCCYLRLLATTCESVWPGLNGHSNTSFQVLLVNILNNNSCCTSIIFTLSILLWVHSFIFHNFREHFLSDGWSDFWATQFIVDTYLSLHTGWIRDSAGRVWRNTAKGVAYEAEAIDNDWWYPVIQPQRTGHNWHRARKKQKQKQVKVKSHKWRQRGRVV